MVREELRLLARELPEERLQSVWRALDADNSGFVTAGEFGRFMRQGKRADGVPWRERVGAKNRAAAEEVKADLDRRVGRDVSQQLAEVRPAGGELVQQMSERLNAKMDVLFLDPQSREWFKLYAHMDDDGSGRISYREFSGLVREELKMGGREFPEPELQSVWRALDADNSGVCSVPPSDPTGRAPLPAPVLAVQCMRQRRLPTAALLPIIIL